MLTPQRRAEMQAILGRQTATPNNTNTQVSQSSGVLTPERRAQMHAVLGGSGVSTQTQPAQQPKSIGGFAQNVVKSGVNAVKDIGSAVVNVANPDMEKNTVANLGKLAGGINSYTPAGFISSQIASAVSPQARQMRDEGRQAVKQVGQMYGQRYGSPQKAFDTLYNDPVGVALDVSTIAGGVGAVGGTSKVGRVARTVSRYTDPIQATGKATGKVFSKGLNKAGTAIEGVGEGLVTGGLGQPKTLKNIEKVSGKKVADLINEYDLYDRTAEGANIAIQNVDNLYNQVARASDKPVAIKEILMKFDEEIAKRVPNAKLSEAVATELDNLKTRKKAFIDYVGMREELPLSELTQIKSAVGMDIPSSKWAMDAAQTGKSNSARTTYNVYKDRINEVVPQAKQLGRDEAALIKLKEVFENYNARGNARQNLNFTRLGSAGVGSVLAGLPGLVGGYALESIVNSPAGIKALSKVTRGTGRAVKKASETKIPRTFSKKSNGVYVFGKGASRVNEEEQE